MSAPACVAAGIASGVPSPWGAMPWAVWLSLGLLLAVVAALVAVYGRLARRASDRERLARRADRNGRALLELADEIDLAVLLQSFGGDAALPRRHWSRLCRRLAMEHLECINRLMFDSQQVHDRADRDRAARR